MPFDACINQEKTEFFFIANRNVSAAISDKNCPFRDLHQSRISASPLMILSLCILKSTLFVNLLILTYVTFGVCVALSPLKHATRSLEDWSFPVLTMPTLFFLARARLTLLVYNACRTRLRGWLCLADATSDPLTCLGSYTGSLLNKESFTNSCYIFTKL